MAVHARRGGLETVTGSRRHAPVRPPTRLRRPNISPTQGFDSVHGALARRGTLFVARSGWRSPARWCRCARTWRECRPRQVL